MKDKDLQGAIETLIDQSSLGDVMEAIVHVCFAKAEHLRVNWQATEDAKLWEKDAKALDKIVGRLEN